MPEAKSPSALVAREQRRLLAATNPVGLAPSVESPVGISCWILVGLAGIFSSS